MNAQSKSPFVVFFLSQHPSSIPGEMASDCFKVCLSAGDDRAASAAYRDIIPIKMIIFPFKNVASEEGKVESTSSLSGYT